MSRRKDYTGKKFSHLTILAYAKPGGKGRHPLWLARCDCGEVKEIVAHEAERGAVKSCGKCQYHRDLMISRKASNSRGNVTLRRLYAREVTRALSRERPWSLTPEEFTVISSQSCFYCDAPPLSYVARKKVSFSGIDTVDIPVGYTPESSVACCTSCLRMKGAENAVDFLDKVRRIAVKCRLFE